MWVGASVVCCLTARAAGVVDDEAADSSTPERAAARCGQSEELGALSNGRLETGGPWMHYSNKYSTVQYPVAIAAHRCKATGRRTLPQRLCR